MDEKRINEIESWAKDNEWLLGPWLSDVLHLAISQGIWDYKNSQLIRGFVDAHVHLCRVFTFNPEYFPAGVHLNEIADLDLTAKQDLTGMLHDGSAYTSENLELRMRRQIERAIKIGTREIWGVTDTTPDIGTRAFDVALKLKEAYANDVALKVGCYALFGFKDPRKNPDRLALMRQCAPVSDFIVGLPEKDDGHDKIGFKSHVNYLLDLAFHANKPLHIHVDQKNSAHERGSIMVVECLEGLLQKKFDYFTEPGVPKIWLIHVISPSCYNPEKFSRLVSKLVKYNIGVIVCPVAGISMRQLRSEEAPIHNSLARVIELLRAGVEVRLGTDNVHDFLVPSNIGLIPYEIMELSNVVRNYITHILVKTGMGISLNNGDRALLKQSVYEASKACARHKDWMDQCEDGSGTDLFDY
jgi:cytosine/adenosine deaminase-related metal-dependent hydrolase